MVQSSSEENTPDYVVNARWFLEGILLPVIGGLGFGGKNHRLSFWWKYFSDQNVSINFSAGLLFKFIFYFDLKYKTLKGCHR